MVRYESCWLQRNVNRFTPQSTTILDTETTMHRHKNQQTFYLLVTQHIQGVGQHCTGHTCGDRLDGRANQHSIVVAGVR